MLFVSFLLVYSYATRTIAVNVASATINASQHGQHNLSPAPATIPPRHPLELPPLNICGPHHNVVESPISGHNDQADKDFVKAFGSCRSNYTCQHQCFHKIGRMLWQWRDMMPERCLHECFGGCIHQFSAAGTVQLVNSFVSSDFLSSNISTRLAALTLSADQVKAIDRVWDRVAMQHAGRRVAFCEVALDELNVDDAPKLPLLALAEAYTSTFGDEHVCNAYHGVGHGFDEVVGGSQLDGVLRVCMQLSDNAKVHCCATGAWMALANGSRRFVAAGSTLSVRESFLQHPCIKLPVDLPGCVQFFPLNVPPLLGGAYCDNLFATRGGQLACHYALGYDTDYYARSPLRQAVPVGNLTQITNKAALLATARAIDTCLSAPVADVATMRLYEQRMQRGGDMLRLHMEAQYRTDELTHDGLWDAVRARYLVPNALRFDGAPVPWTNANNKTLKAAVLTAELFDTVFGTVDSTMPAALQGEHGQRPAHRDYAAWRGVACMEGVLARHSYNVMQAEWGAQRETVARSWADVLAPPGASPWLRERIFAVAHNHLQKTAAITFVEPQMYDLV